MGPFQQFKYDFLANLFKGLNTLWEVWAVIVVDPIDFFDASAWEGLLAALVASGLAVGRKFLMDITTLAKDFVMKKAAALLGLFR